MDKTPRTRFLHLRLATVAVAAVIVAFVAVRKSHPTSSPTARAFVFKEGDPDLRPGDNKRAIIGPNESRWPDYTPEVEAYLLRAYPEAEVPGEATLNARSGWAALNASAPSAGSWQLIGPSKATYPAVLNPFLFDGARYVASGRVTAMAIAPSCTQNQCTLYVAAAGGGVWRTDKALLGSNWRFVSGGFGINAIGSLLIDPSDSSGNTLYAGTGEPNASGDSEAGVGIYKTTDGGQTWTFVPGSDIFFQRAIGQMAFDNAGNLLVPIASSIRGYSSVTSGASSSASTTHPLALRGLYRQTGATFTIIRPIVAVATARGSTTVQVDPTHAGVIYVNEFSRGVWRSVDNGTTWTQIKTPLNAGLSTDRAEFAVTTLANGFTRMYVGVGNQSDSGANRARFYRTDDASGAAVFADMTTAQNIGYCTAQCWYDNVVYTPAGSPDVVYLGGSFSYGQLHAQSNGRGWLLSTDGGTAFSDLTQDGDPNHAEGIHPDQHAIVTVPGKPLQFITGSDGGVVRSDGKFADISYKCDERGLSTADNALCKILLSRVANQLVNMNNGLSTLQFQSLSVSAQRPQNLLQGGTQDNGTFQYNGSRNVWPQVIYGDGGQSGFNAANDGLRFNTFTGKANDANFRDGDPTKWVIISAPILSSPEGTFFYPPIIADPNPAKAGSIFQGSFSVWRTQDWGGDRDYLEANCPEFTTSSDQAGCGDFVIIGNGVPSTQLTSAAWGTRFNPNAAVAWITRAPQNTGTMWAATSTGRVFITDNADAAAASVVWNRVDPTPQLNTPTRAISAIAVDPADAHHAWISYNGYNVNTPGQPGHVFEVTWRGVGAATWVDVSSNLPDFPITAVVQDDVTGDLYAASDFGVMRLAGGAATWTVAGSGLPMVEVPGLTIVPSARILYAATHGRSAWSLALP
ncbi:MAG TPA: exo-alpha-sialidase [Vicinamibacteria bacterium]|nr:exo-alpha-sialidase [Vicinamibacteria bacterium]